MVYLVAIMKRILIGVGVILLATGAFAQEKPSCEEQLLLVQKQIIVLQASRNQTEANLAAVLARLEKEAEKNAPK